MTEQPFLPPLPPLSVKALHDLQEIEDFLAEQLKDCDEFFGGAIGVLARHNSPKRIERVLRTCLVEHLDVQLNYYLSLPQYRPTWIVKIIGSSIGSILGQFSIFSSGEQYRGILFQTATEHLKTRAPEFPKPQKSLPLPPSETEPTPIKDQLELLREECRITVEKLAEGIGLDPRSVYRHLSGEAAPRARQIGAYEKLFSKRLSRSVRLETSVKRQ